MVALDGGHVMCVAENIYFNRELTNRIQVEKLATTIKGMAASNDFKKEFYVRFVLLPCAIMYKQ